MQRAHVLWVGSALLTLSGCASRGATRTEAVAGGSAGGREVRIPAELSLPALEAHYDTLSDSTVLVTRAMSLAGVSSLSFRAFVSHAGRTLDEPPAYVVLGFFSNSSAWRFLNNQTIQFRADGTRRYGYSEVARDGEVHRRSRDVSVSEQLTIVISVAEFLELANARTLEGSVGYLRFTVQPENLAVLDSLAGRLAPAPSVSRP